MLNAGWTATCTATVTPVAGQHAAQVQVVAWDNDGRRTTADDPVHYYGTP